MSVFELRAERRAQRRPLGQAAICAALVAAASVLLLGLMQDSLGSVCGTVVDDDDLQLLIRLAANGG